MKTLCGTSVICDSLNNNCDYRRSLVFNYLFNCIKITSHATHVTVHSINVVDDVSLDVLWMNN